MIHFLLERMDPSTIAAGEGLLCCREKSATISANYLSIFKLTMIDWD